MVSIPKSQVERDVFGNIAKIIRTWLITGELKVPDDIIAAGTSQAWLNTAIRQLETAYNRDGGNAILYWPDGTPSPQHWAHDGRLEQAFALDRGVHLVDGRAVRMSGTAAIAPMAFTIPTR